MTLANGFLAALGTKIPKRLHLPIVGAISVIICGVTFIEYQNNTAHANEQKENVSTKLHAVQDNLQIVINTQVERVNSLANILALDPMMSENGFSDALHQTFLADNSFNLVMVTLKDRPQQIHVLRDEQWIAGGEPLEISRVLEQAGVRASSTARPQTYLVGYDGAILFNAPIMGQQAEGAPQLMGTVTARANIDALMHKSGVNSAGINMALEGPGETRYQRELYYGSPAVGQANALTVTVDAPAEAWKLQAVPYNGWEKVAPNVWVMRGFSALIAGLLVLPIWLAGMLLSDRMEQRRRLHTMTRRLEIAMKATNIGVWELNLETNHLYWDPRMCEMYDIPYGKVTQQTWTNRVHPEDYPAAQDAFDKAIENQTLFDFQYRIVLPSGDIRHVRSMGAVEGSAVKAASIVGANWDISDDVRLNDQLRRAKELSEVRNQELENTKSKIEELALHDVLTGLPNRRFLDDKLAELYGQSDIDAGMLNIDLDRFKQINDTMGHLAGDALLTHVASILRSAVRESDFVARIGGDEFVIICKSPCDKESMGKLAQRIIDKIGQPFKYEGRECRCGVSIGIAMTDVKNATADQLFVNADIALYRAKKTGRNHYEFFTVELRTAVVQTKRIADELLSGIDRGEFIAHYQGQFDAKTHKISGVEALARWQHPEKGLLPPAAFIEVAEDLNILPTIDLIVLEQSLVQMRKWRRAGVVVPTVSVNVSSRRLSDPDLIASLKKLKFEPGTLTFELVESTYLDQQSDQVAWNIDQIKEAGIEIEIDDFGTGYASIVSLLQLKPKRLKIDRQLVLPVLESPGQRALVRSIVEIGSSLGIESIAEGVETMEHARILYELGCTGLQGYALARPMSGADFTKFARDWKPQGVEDEAAA